MLQPRAVRTVLAPAPSHDAPYTQAIVSGPLVFASGQLPLDPATGALVAGGIEEQTTQALRNLRGVLDAAGSALEHLLKVTVFLADLEDWPAMNAVYRMFVGDPAPARSAVEVARLGFDALVEVEAIAWIPS